MSANGLAAVPPRLEWVTLSERKWVNCRERRGSLALFLRATMQNAVREGVRYAVTYQTSGGLCQDDSIKTIVKNSAVGFLDDTALGVATWEGDRPGGRSHLAGPD